MRHGKGLKKLNRTNTHRKAMMMNMAVSLFKHEQIKTTLPKAKMMRPFVEKLITLARKKSLHTIRQLNATLQDSVIVKKLIDDIAPRFAKRPGGYTRIYKFGFRYGDMAPMSILELVDRNPNAPKAKSDNSKEKKDEAATVKQLPVADEKKKASASDAATKAAAKPASKTKADEKKQEKPKAADTTATKVKKAEPKAKTAKSAAAKKDSSK